MISTATWSIDRTALSLAPLVLSGSEGPLSVLRDGLVLPSRAREHAWAYASSVIDGNLSMGSRLLTTAWVLPVRVDGESVAAIDAQIAEVETAVSQHAFTLTYAADDSASSWACWAADVAEDVAGKADAVYETYGLITLTIPCQPIPGVA